MVVFPGPAIDAEAVDAVGIVTTEVLFDSYVLGTAPAFEEMTSLKEMDAPETNFL